MALPARTRPRGLFIPILLLLLLILCIVVPGAQAKNPYQMTCSTEGDPGDGVLRPVPRINQPEPLPRTFGLIFALEGADGLRYDNPVLVLPFFFMGQILPLDMVGMASPLPADILLVAEGRWTDAP